MLCGCNAYLCSFFFFNDTATTEIYTLSLHDALPILEETEPHAPAEASRAPSAGGGAGVRAETPEEFTNAGARGRAEEVRSEEHTSELQSRQYLVCRLLLEKKKKRCKSKGRGTQRF